jgi:hypothetical protein
MIPRVDAVISGDGKYRYVLRRSLGSILRWHKPMLFIMLNPSTADAETDDPTIRRCMAFAKREGATHLNVVNLFALRATDPNELLSSEDPIGPENDTHIAQEIRNNGMLPVICAWGAHKFATKRAGEVTSKGAPGGFVCFGQTKSGMPKHPLYLKATQPLEEFKLIPWTSEP